MSQPNEPALFEEISAFNGALNVENGHAAESRSRAERFNWHCKEQRQHFTPLYPRVNGCS